MAALHGRLEIDDTPVARRPLLNSGQKLDEIRLRYSFESRLDCDQRAQSAAGASDSGKTKKLAELLQAQS